jgi:lysine 2,3-aminomutase
MLSGHLKLTPEEIDGVRATERLFRFGTTPYYLSLADPNDSTCPVRMQIVPRAEEARSGSGELEDPLGEQAHTPVPGIVHKYPDRALLIAFDRCAVYCRHCTRRRLAERGPLDRQSLDRAVDYLASRREIRDVLVSGGDPLLLSTPRLERLLSRIRAIRHVEILRLGTRLPVCNPMRIDRELVAALRRLRPLFVITHFNHPLEVTPESRAACETLVDAGIPVENQTVLIRRLNSSARIITDLCHRLLTMRVRPYYLHQMDLALGLEHLRTPLAKGVEIIESMRGYTSGLAVPHFAVDLPGGGGKVTLQPRYLVAQDEHQTTFRSWEGGTYRYPEPRERDCACPYEAKLDSTSSDSGRE